VPTMPTRVEVAIGGGGPSGLATALSLAREAPDRVDDIAVLEQATYPRDKFCAGGFGLRGDRILWELGVDIDVPSVSIDAMSLKLRSGSVVERADRPIGRVIRRAQFDHELAKATRGRGVRILEGTRVVGLSRDGQHMVLDTNKGPLRARVVVGADGVGGLVRRASGLEMPTLHAQVVEVDTEPVHADLPRDTLHFESDRPGLSGYTWDFPTLVDGEERVCRGAYVLLGNGTPHHQDAPCVLEGHLQERGLHLAHYRQKRFGERAYARSADLSRPRVLLVGETAGIDPITGEGIPQALSYGQLAGRYLAARLDEGNLEFADWASEVRKEFFGWELGLREAVVPYFYGPHRQWLERFLLEEPWFLRAGLEVFAGRRIPRAWLVRGGWFGLRLAARAALSLSG
jgi:flavin-dependent dehydrogenase